MAFENIGIGAFLKFNAGPAVAQMTQAARATNGLAAAQARLGRMIQGGIGSFGGLLTSGALAIGFSAGAKAAGEFEEQMNTVKAVAGASAREMQTLIDTAKIMGTGVYGAKQVGSAMEELARGGFDAVQVTQALPGVMNAAAAEGMSLSDATRILTQGMHGMGLEATDMTRIADVYAKASASSNSSITSVGSAMSYVGGAAHQMGLSLETTVSMVGALENAGQRGSRAGTNLQQMLTKLANPNKKAAEWLRKHKIAMRTFADGSLDVVGVITDVNRALQKESNVVEQARIKHEVFGERGGRAMAALGTAISSGKLAELQREMNNAAGAAEKMSKTRFEGFLAGLTKIKNSLNVLVIEGFSGMTKALGPGIHDFAGTLKDIVTIVVELTTGTGKLRGEFELLYGDTATAIAYGFVDAFRTMGEAIRDAWRTITDFISTVTGRFSPDFIESVTKWSVIIAGVAAAVTPIMLAFMGLLLFITTVVVPTITALFTPVGVIIVTIFGGAITTTLNMFTFLFMATRSKGESFGMTMQKIAYNVRDAWDTTKDVFYILGKYIQAAGILLAKVGKVAVVVASAMSGVGLAFLDDNPLYKMLSEHADSADFKNFGDLQNQISAGIKTRREDRGKERLAAELESGQVAVNRATEGADKNLQGLLKQTYDPAWEKKQLDAAGKVGSAGRLAEQKRIYGLRDQIKAAISENTEAKTLSNMATAPGEDFMDGVRKEFRGLTPQGRVEQAQKLTDTVNDKLANLTGEVNKQPVVKVSTAIVDHRKLDVHNCVQVDGRELAKAYAKHAMEVQERAGFKTTPYQRKMIAEHGAVNVSVDAGAGK